MGKKITKSKYKITDNVNPSKAATNPDRLLSGSNKPKPGMRDRSTIKRLKLYKTKPVRNSVGKIMSGSFMSNDTSHSTRIEPNRRWFGNTRVVGQKQLEKLREDLNTTMKDPYLFILKQNKVPMGLLTEPKATRMSLLETESFQDTFGPKNKRKKPKIFSGDLEQMVEVTSEKTESYSEIKDSNIKSDAQVYANQRLPIFDKGQSKRIWTELYKVIDSSDVLIQVLDARDPMGTRCPHIEKHLDKERKHKNLIFVLNKCDLVPTWVTARWVKILSKEKPTLAFHSSITNSFGKGSLIQLLRQFAILHKDKKQISVGFIGYPNVGKSSIINTLRAKKVCKVAPVPGETKVWQYIQLFKRIFLVDCPGVVHGSGDSETDLVLKGVVRIVNLQDAADYVPKVLELVKRDYLIKTYGVQNWDDHIDFLTQLAAKSGRLLKGGEPDLNTCGKMVLSDWQRGKLPYFVAPPEKTVEELKEEAGGSEGKAREALKEARKRSNDQIISLKIEQNFDNIKVRDELFTTNEHRNVSESDASAFSLPASFVDYDQIETEDEDENDDDDEGLEDGDLPESDNEDLNQVKDEDGDDDDDDVEEDDEDDEGLEEPSDPVPPIEFELDAEEKRRVQRESGFLLPSKKPERGSNSFGQKGEKNDKSKKPAKRSKGSLRSQMKHKKQKNFQNSLSDQTYIRRKTRAEKKGMVSASN
eukprot:TRINITY_DN3356_c0_g1_i1.p1 TRINITY_DN3356_c0_g1~~TRINITY_DN3356_c0_g1_i1.p1  ORF type:complete len:733 (+),score=379.35 TRINITY_DN3356_c0_g1_i1:104-2200(+)